MKKLSLILGVGALLLASCSNDDLVVKNGTENGNEPAKVTMKLGMRTANVSRADAQLEDTNHDFGVFAYKGGANAADINTDAAHTVMNNYLVGYTKLVASVDGEGNTIMVPDYGYKRADGRENLDEAYTTAQKDWIYEGLGNDDGSKYRANNTDEWADNTKSAVVNQYLRYWDFEMANTYFYGYTPYAAAATIAKSGDNMVMTLPEVTTANAGSTMYAFTKVDNAAMKWNAETSATDNTAANYNKTVTMKFYRVESRLRVAFWGKIEGYNVEIVDWGTNTTTTPTGTGVSLEGEYTDKGTPVITFGEITDTPVLSYTGATTSTTDLVFECPMKYGPNMNDLGAAPYYLPESRAERIGSDWVYVLPNIVGTDMTFKITLKLTGIGTGEVMYIQSKVAVPANLVAWKPNTQYVYIFHITKNVPGVDDDPALYPIIFDDVLVSDYASATEHDDWNYHEDNDWEENVHNHGDAGNTTH